MKIFPKQFISKQRAVKQTSTNILSIPLFYTLDHDDTEHGNWPNSTGKITVCCVICFRSYLVVLSISGLHFYLAGWGWGLTSKACDLWNIYLSPIWPSVLQLWQNIGSSFRGFVNSFLCLIPNGYILAYGQFWLQWIDFPGPLPNTSTLNSPQNAVPHILFL